MRAIIAALVVAFLALVIAVAGNVIWQSLYCGTPINKCNPVQIAPCESISTLTAERARLERLAEAYPAQ